MSAALRVLHFFKTYLPDSLGGVEQHIFQLCRGLPAFGIDSDVLSVSRAADLTPRDFPGHRGYRARLSFEVASTPFSWRVLPLFARLAARADIVHYHYPWPFMDLAHFLVRHGKPTVVTYESDIVRQAALARLYGPLGRRFLTSVDCIVATSPNYVATSTVLQRFRDKVEIVPIGLDPAAYPPATPERLAAWRARLGGRFFLFVGRLRYYKGLSVLLEALRENDYPTALLGDGPMEAALRAQAAALGLRNLHFLGALDDVDKIALLQLCTALAFPSHLRAEAFGISLLEASLFGKPMISCELGTGTSYVNRDGETGLVVAPQDPGALGDALRRLWHDPALAARLGAGARARFLACFTAERMQSAYAALYRRLLARPPGDAG